MGGPVGIVAWRQDEAVIIKGLHGLEQSPGDPMQQPQAGGSSCQWSGQHVLVQLELLPSRASRMEVIAGTGDDGGLGCSLVWARRYRPWLGEGCGARASPHLLFHQGGPQPSPLPSRAAAERGEAVPSWQKERWFLPIRSVTFLGSSSGFPGTPTLAQDGNVSLGGISLLRAPHCKAAGGVTLLFPGGKLSLYSFPVGQSRAQ